MNKPKIDDYRQDDDFPHKFIKDFEIWENEVKSTMEIVNVIEIKKGVLDNIQSFVILSEDNKQEIVAKAEALFIKKARENGAEESEYFDEDLLDMGNWDNENGYEVLITWSEINN